MRLVVCKVAEQFVKNNEIAQVNFVPREPAALLVALLGLSAPAAGRESKKLCCTIYRPTDLIHVLHLILTHPPLNEELFTTCRRGLFQRQQVKCFALVAVNLCEKITARTAKRLVRVKSSA